MLRRGQPVSQAGRYLNQFAPDVVVTDEASLASGDAPLQWRSVMNPVSFVAHWTPEVENALRAKALRQRWDREAKAYPRVVSTRPRTEAAWSPNTQVISRRTVRRLVQVATRAAVRW